MSEDDTTPLCGANSAPKKASSKGEHNGYRTTTRPQHLSWFRKLSYGVGHVFNDLAASMWFTYLILFYHKVILLDNTLAGTLLLIGQAVDGIATPIVGFLCDSTRFWFMGFGRRKIWHLIGTLLVSISLFFFWHTCLPCTTRTPLAWEIVWYAIFIAIFQMGWACVQISHLSLIPELTADKHERVELNSIRTAFTILSNVGVFVAMWVLLREVGEKNSNTVSLADEWIFSGTVLGIIVVGLIFSFAFQIGTVEPRSRAQQREEKQEGLKIQWYRWFKKPQFYLVAGIYMCTRLIVNISQIYTPLYLLESLSLPRDSVAVGPLAIYISGFLTTLLLKKLNKVIGRYMTYFCGLALIWGALMWFWQQNPPFETALPHVEQWTVYGSTLLLGAGGATLLVTSLSMVADLIGPTVGSSAFVYGLMSFTDKVSNGVAVQVIQALHPCRSITNVCCSLCEKFYRIVVSAVPGGASLFALLCVTLLTIFIYRQRRQWKEVAPACSKSPDITTSDVNKSLQNSCSSNSYNSLDGSP